MAKLALVLFVTLTISFGLLDTVKSEEEEEHAPSSEGGERSGHARLAVAPALYRPGAHGAGRNSPGPLGGHQCLTCIDCPDASQASIRSCQASIDPLKSGLCVTYSEKYNNQKEAVVRGCVSERGTCAEIRKALNPLHVSVLYCHECKGDKCNGASRSVTDLTMAFVALIVTPLLAKVTLS